MPYAIAIHGGAGAIDADAAPDQRQPYLDGLARALAAGRDLLARGGTALDAVELAVRTLEDDPHFNAGQGSVYNAVGTHELDAAIMDGTTLACGAVAGVTTVRNPISLARAVMERSPHVLLAGDGAEQFATHLGLPRVDNHHFDTPQRYAELQRTLEQPKANPAAPHSHLGTVGAVALDAHGHLAAATSTGGMTAKRFGRVGDSPLIGAGTYADDRTVAVSCTGVGEQFIRHAVAHDLWARLAYKGQPLRAAAEHILHTVLRPDDGGLIALTPAGEIVTMYNTHGMYRGVADSGGRFEVHIFDDGTGDGPPAP
jgi:beta-aspartyl-peptidase (threonine type)